MAINYVPILRYRDKERGALKSVPLSAKCLPLIELVQGPDRRGKTAKTFESQYTKELSALKRPLIVDFPMYVRLSQRTQDGIYKFLSPIHAAYATRIDLFLRLKAVPGLIPVVTYNPNQLYQAGLITSQVSALREHFPRIAFRLYPDTGFQAAHAEVATRLAADDIVILDIHDQPHAAANFQPLYRQVQALPNCVKVLGRSAINLDVRNVDLVDGQQIAQADNSLLRSYRAHGFDAFADYAGIKKDLLLEGRGISPGYIFYDWTGNLFVGYRYRLSATTPHDKLREFKLHIGPSVVRSPHFTALSTQHRASCPGCRKIHRIVNGPDTGANQGLWKQIAVEHYLYTMEECL